MGKPYYSVEELGTMTIGDLRNILVKLGGTPANKPKATLVDEIIRIVKGELLPVRSKRGRPSTRVARFCEEEDCVRDSGPLPDTCEGLLELNQEGYGFVRAEKYEPSPKDAFIAAYTIRKYGLREGDMVKGKVEYKRQNKLPEMMTVTLVNGKEPMQSNRPRFDDLIPYYPDKKFNLGAGGQTSLRIIDLFCPVGKGQRGLIVAPPKTGKTTILKRIAGAVDEFYPEVSVMVLLIDERPEEVTDFRAAVKGEVIASTFDQTAEHHVHVAETCFKRAKALVEDGKDVLILLDSITKLARAYNVVLPASGKLLSGGMDPAALQTAKKYFGLARNTNAGSLTIIATALVDTGSRLDDIVFEEFKGTGNMEIKLSRELAEKRIFPAIDVLASGTRKEELLLSEKEEKAASEVRRTLTKETDVSEIIDLVTKTQNNVDFCDIILEKARRKR